MAVQDYGMLLLWQLPMSDRTRTSLRAQGVLGGRVEGGEFVVLLKEEHTPVFYQGSGSDWSKWRRIE